MLHDDFAAALLEKEGAFLHVWVELAVHEDTGFDVLLGALAKDFVLTHDALVRVANESEVFLGRVLVAPDLVVHDRLGGRLGHELLHKEEVLGHGEGGVGEAVCRADLLAESFAVLGCVGLVLDVVGVAVDVVGLEVDQAGGEIGVCALAVVALVEVVGENLPVEGTVQVPSVVELVIVKVELVEAGLFVDSVEL